jgi:hypothetical protein
MYKLSKDYETLYLFIELRHTPIAFVDYHSSRDICQVKLFKDKSINFTSRGIEYGSVDCLKDEFIKECQRLNVEWVLPLYADKKNKK